MSSPQTACLQQLIQRRDKVLAVLHPPTAAHARIMERAGCEALFVGTGGIAGVRIDDQPIEGKRATQSAGVEVVPLDLAIARYRAAIDMKNELDPDFIVMVQCYARAAEWRIGRR